ncbi:MAG: DUF2779 domain-containing protein [Mycoplasma sp.]
MNSKIKTTIVTKSDFLNYIKCHRRCFLFFTKGQKSNYQNLPNHDAELITKLIDEQNIDELFMDENENEGVMVGKYAHNYFRDVYQNTKSINIDDYSNELKESKTLMAINDPEIGIIFEATFYYNNAICKIDALVKAENGQLLIYEVKASSKPKTKYAYDVLYQKIILQKLGHQIAQCYLVHLNKNYILKDKLELSELFVPAIKYYDNETGKNAEEIANYEGHLFNDFEVIIDEIIKIKNQWNQIENVDNSSEIYSEKNAELKQGCEIFSYYNGGVRNGCSLFGAKCEAFNYCLKKYNDVDFFNSVFSFNGLKFPKKMYMYSTGYKYVTDLSDYKLIEFELNDNAKNYWEACHSPNGIFVKKEELKHYLSTNYIYPIYMLDFEGVMFGIPILKGTSSFNTLTFQYSIHIIIKPDNTYQSYDERRDSDLIHCEYIADLSKEDFRIELIDKLIFDLNREGNGPIVAFFKAYEEARINDLIKYLELDKNKNREQIDALRSIKSRIIDLQDIFKKEKLFDCKLFNGSYSIKKVLPALDPKFSYKGLEIQNGLAATEAFRYYYTEKFFLKNPSFKEEEWKKTQKNLLKYCYLDTLAMVVIYEKMKKIVNLNT